MVTKHCIILTWENTGWGRQAWCGCGRGTAGTARVGDGEPRAAPRPPTSEGVGGEVQRGADTVSRSSLSEEGTSCPSLRRSWCDAAEMRAGRPLTSIPLATPAMTSLGSALQLSPTSGGGRTVCAVTHWERAVSRGVWSRIDGEVVLHIFSCQSSCLINLSEPQKKFCFFLFFPIKRLKSRTGE